MAAECEALRISARPESPDDSKENVEADASLTKARNAAVSKPFINLFIFTLLPPQKLFEAGQRLVPCPALKAYLVKSLLSQTPNTLLCSQGSAQTLNGRQSDSKKGNSRAAVRNSGINLGACQKHITAASRYTDKAGLVARWNGKGAVRG